MAVGKAASLLDLVKGPFPLQVACEIIPFPSVKALYQFLHRNRAEFTPVYRRSRGYDVRMLSLEDIAKIRKMTLQGAEQSHAHSAMQNAARSAAMRGKRNAAKKVAPLLSGVYARAMGHA